MATSSGIPTTGRVLAGRYRLGSRRGAGLDIAIFEAFDEQVDRQVTVRLVHPDICATPGFAERFRDTMQKVASLTHPNLATVLDWGPAEWNGQAVQFVVTEDLAGGSLRDLLDRGRLLSPSQALVIGLDVCRALDAAHRHGLVHGDVRPANVLFGTDRRLRLVDLGLAELAGEHLWADPSGVSLERARYASPERARGVPLEPKSDVYSLALLLIEVVSGHVPFSADSTVATLANRIDRLMPVTADLGALAAVLERAGRPQPDTRFTAAEFGRAMVHNAEKLPRPAPIPLVGSGLASEGRDQTGPLRLGTVPVDITAPLAPPDLATWVPAPTAPPEGAKPDTSAPAATAPVANEDRAAADAPTVATAATPPTSTPLTPAVSAPDPAATTVMAATSANRTQVMPKHVGPAGTTARVAASVPTAAGVPPPPPEEDEEPPLLGEHRTRRKVLALVMVIVLAAGIGGAVALYVNRDRSNLVPEGLVGMDSGGARNLISGFGWEIVETKQSSDTVESGKVISVDPVAGTRLDRGDTFSMIVSTGPAPRVLPDITGLPIDVATNTLESLGLVLQERREPDETVPVGTVVSWTVPAQPGLGAGGTAVPGTEILAIVSSGPVARAVPDVTNLSLEEATAALEELGLVVSQLPDEFSDEIETGLVARQNPVGGVNVMVEKGSTVEIALSKGQDLVAVPVLVDLTLADATAALTAADLTRGAVTGDETGFVTEAFVDGVPVAAGDMVKRASPVALTLVAPPPTTTVPPTTEAPTTTAAPVETTVPPA